MQVVTGCAYGDLRDLDDALQRRRDLQLIQLEDVISLNLDGMFLADGTFVLYKDIGSSYIRYPYDLIPPNSRDFFVREKTEFLKTLAAMLAEVDLTPLHHSWVMRNRIYGLGQMEKFGFLVAHSQFSMGTDQGSYPLDSTGSCTVKAGGNCYFSDVPTADVKPPLPQIHLASDGDDHALIFPASECSRDEVVMIQKTLGSTFTQETIHAHAEYRIYCVGQQVFAYKREAHDQHDRSAAPYVRAHDDVEAIRDRLITFCSHLKIGYICCDAMSTSQGFIFIDLNPNGGMPKHSKHPEVVDAVADLLHQRASAPR